MQRRRSWGKALLGTVNPASGRERPLELEETAVWVFRSKTRGRLELQIHMCEELAKLGGPQR